MSLYHQYKSKGLRLLLVSADEKEELPAVKKFLAQHGVDFSSYRKNQKDQAFIDGLSKEWSGALPVTFIYNSSGQQVDFWEGDKPKEYFESHILKVINQGPQKLSKEKI